MLLSLGTQSSKTFNQPRHRTLFVIEVPDFDMSRLQHLGRFKQLVLPSIRVPSSLAIQEPVGQEFEFDVLDPIFVENLLPLLQRAALKNVIQVGMPYTETFETGSGRRLHTILEIEGAVFPVGVR